MIKVEWVTPYEDFVIAPYIVNNVRVRKHWYLKKKQLIKITLDNGTEFLVRLEKGTVSNGGSVPICSPIERMGDMVRYFFLHDEIYGNPYLAISCKEADEILRLGGVQDGTPKWKANSAYALLRTYGMFGNPNYEERI